MNAHGVGVADGVAVGVGVDEGVGVAVGVGLGVGVGSLEGNVESPKLPLLVQLVIPKRKNDSSITFSK